MLISNPIHSGNSQRKSLHLQLSYLQLSLVFLLVPLPLHQQSWSLELIYHSYRTPHPCLIVFINVLHYPQILLLLC